jgi:hypothetical protein
MSELDYNREPICPFCGHKESDAWELNMYDGDETEIDCDCGETYIVECSVSVTYSTRKKVTR